MEKNEETTNFFWDGCDFLFSLSFFPPGDEVFFLADDVELTTRREEKFHFPYIITVLRLFLLLLRSTCHYDPRGQSAF